MNAVLLPDPDGGAPVALLPSYRTWITIEAKHGGSLGALYLALQTGRVQLSVAQDLVYLCAKNAGATLTWDQVGERLHRLGLFRIETLVRELFADICKPEPEPERDPPDAGEATDAGPLP